VWKNNFRRYIGTKTQAGDFSPSLFDRLYITGEYHETDPPFIIEADPGLIIEIDPPLIM
jgi:hypothetical protein